ncbi:hypothetical protein [Tautonia plasticadhaerens]|uniref:Glycosyltransferase RgtA/B/C/D-like domain-containing protein n=1 Tax=Tautonia plasticadhaerens TaxID=2527974 RepID=A0A518H1T1_9BACT|nr:hypothetical protein [Tautonia plasticadhaerens]QDV34798.1 hypothetical protein ElP_26940 [Tautonia plasticadhaerens]
MSRATTPAPSPEVIAPRRLRADAPLPVGLMAPARLAAGLAVAVIVAFTLLGAGNLDLGPGEARLGMAAGDRVGPFGLVYGSWEPGLLPARVLPSLVWAWFYGGVTAASAAIRWPEAIAASLIALASAHRLRTTLGPRASVLGALTAAGSLAMIDRSSAGLGALDAAIGWLWFGATGGHALMLTPILPDPNLVGGLLVVLALDRLRSRGAGPAVGLLAGLAGLAGGWPMMAVVAIPSVVLRRREGSRPALAVLGALAVVGGWSAWAWSTARFDAWAAAVALPLMEGPCWTLAIWAAAYALPWSPMAGLVGFESVRSGWSEEGRSLVVGWLKIAGALALAGTLVPGLGDAARVPILFGLAVASAAVLERVLGGWPGLSTGARRAFWAAAIAASVGWATVAIPTFGYAAAAIGTYRTLAVLLIGLAPVAAAAAVLGGARSRPALGLAALVLVAGSLKLAHWGVVVPEWNYRASQGPWARAIGQWIPRRSTLYFINTTAFDPSIPDRDRWPADLAFHTSRRVRQLPAPEALGLEPEPQSPHFVLLHPTELEHWPDSAPELVLVREMQDKYGSPRVLARTGGPMYPDRREELGE